MGRSRIVASRSTSSASLFPRGRPCFGEPVDRDVVVGHASTSRTRLRRSITMLAPRLTSARRAGRNDMRVGRARTEDPLVVDRGGGGWQSSVRSPARSSRCSRKTKADLPLDVHRCEAIAEAGDPGLDPLAPSAQAVPEPVLHVVGRRRPICPEVRLDRTRSSLVEVRHARPSAGCRRGAGTSSRLPCPGPKLKSPCQANAFSNVQGFPSKTKVRCRNCDRAVIAAPSSSSVSGPSARARRTTSRRGGQSDGARL